MDRREIAVLVANRQGGNTGKQYKTAVGLANGLVQSISLGSHQAIATQQHCRKGREQVQSDKEVHMSLYFSPLCSITNINRRKARAGSVQKLPASLYKTKVF